MYGYKERALESIKRKMLPSLSFNVFTSVIDLMLILKQWQILFPHWAIRCDIPTNDGTLLPLFGTNLGNKIESMEEKLYQVKTTFPSVSFILSEAPDDSNRDSNIVCWLDGDVLYGEISYQPMTLRSAWVKGKLFPFQITGGPADVLRNGNVPNLFPIGVRDIPSLKNDTSIETMQPRLDYLRRIRNHLLEREDVTGYEYEISVMDNGRIIFWQEISLTENRDRILPGYYF